MIFKLCYNEQIYRCPKQPADLNELHLAVKQVLKDAVPAQYTLKYSDQDGDDIMLANQDDFKCMLDSNSEKNKSIKVYVIPGEAGDSMRASQVSISKSNIQDSFQILPRKDEQQLEQEVANASSKVLDDKEEQKKEELAPPAQDNKQQEEKLEEKQEEKQEEVQAKPEAFSKEKPAVESQAVEADGVIEINPSEDLKQQEQQQNEKRDQVEIVEEVSEEPLQLHLEESKGSAVDEPIIQEIEQVSKAHAADAHNEEADDDDNEQIDLSNKNTLRKFIIDTIQDAMPEIMANYQLNHCGEVKPKKQLPKKDNKACSTKATIKGVVSEAAREIGRIVIGEKEGLSAKIKHESTKPEFPSTKDQEIYITATIKNNGTESFPESVFLQNVGGLYGEMVKIPILGPRTEAKICLTLNSSRTAGNFLSKWRLGYIDTRNMSKYFGDEVNFKVTLTQKVYSKVVQEKAQQLKELLPQTSIETFLEFVNQEPKKGIEVLVEEYLLNNPSQ